MRRLTAMVVCMSLLSCASCAMSCARESARPVARGGGPPPGARQAAPDWSLKSKMTGHFFASTVMLEALVRGNLDAYKSAAAVIASEGEHGPAWSRSTAVRDVANRAREVTTVAAAADAAAELAVTCGSCHLEEGGPKLAIDTPPAAVATGSLRMARHQWAAERMWLGLMQPSLEAWRTGSEVFVSAPLVLDAVPNDAPTAKQADAFTLSVRANAIARAATAATTTAERQRLFGDLYATCASCHALAR